MLGAKASVIGIYSPVNRCLKTSFALTMGQLLSRNERVLYMNLEEYSGFSRLISSQYTQGLSDVLYLYRQGAYSWLKLKAIVYSWGSMDYIPPVRYAEDLNQVSPEDLAMLLERIALESGYEKIQMCIRDRDMGGRDEVEAMKACYFLDKPDALCVAGLVAGQKSDAQMMARVRTAFPDCVLFANTGVTPDTIEEMFTYANAAFVGTYLKKDGVFENPVDPERVKKLMDKANSLRK